MAKAGIVAAAWAVLLAACTTPDGGGAGGGGASASQLAGTSWRLAELQAGGATTRPADTSKYTMAFSADGTVALQLDCNRATGGWESSGPGRLTFAPLAMTSALCLSGSLDTRIARELGEVRGYELVGDRLTLVGTGDAGRIVWVRPSIQPVPG